MASQILGFLVRSQSSGNHSRGPQLRKKIYSYSLYLGKSDWNLSQNSWTRVKAMIGLSSYMGKGGGRGGVHPWVKKFFWSTPEVKKYGGAASLGWRRGSAAENFLTLPCNSRSKNGEKWTLPRVKWVPPPSKIGADSLKMAKVPRELAPQVKNFPAAEGGRQIFDIAPLELTPR